MVLFQNTAGICPDVKSSFVATNLAANCPDISLEIYLKRLENVPKSHQKYLVLSQNTQLKKCPDTPT